MFRLWPVRAFTDNYIWVLERDGVSRVAVVDPGDGQPVIAALDARSLEVGAVLITHHHRDHVGGLRDLIRRYHPPVYGPAAERVSGVDHPLAGGELVSLPDLDIELAVVDLPGHTSGHIGFFGSGFVLVGDTLFTGGCGRVFEGTFEQMHHSLTRLAALPPNTEFYCAHEYTVANLRFAGAVEPENEELNARLRSAEAASATRPCVPGTIKEELETNPFLRCSEPRVVAAAEAHAGRSLDSAAEVFSVLRQWKDGWQA
jgi:hydroxyacylglutathione hydrolase